MIGADLSRLHSIRARIEMLDRQPGRDDEAHNLAMQALDLEKSIRCDLDRLLASEGATFAQVERAGL